MFYGLLKPGWQEHQNLSGWSNLLESEIGHYKPNGIAQIILFILFDFLFGFILFISEIFFWDLTLFVLYFLSVEVGYDWPECLMFWVEIFDHIDGNIRNLKRVNQSVVGFIEQEYMIRALTLGDHFHQPMIVHRFIEE